MDTWQEVFPCCLSPPSHSGWILTEEGTILLLLVFNYAGLIQGSTPYMFHVTWCWPSSPLSEKQEPFVDSFSGVSIRACICSQRLETPSSHDSHKNSQAAVQQKTGMLQDFPQPSSPTFLASTTTLREGWDGRKEQQPWLGTFSSFGRSENPFWFLFSTHLHTHTQPFRDPLSFYRPRFHQSSS